MKWAIDVSGYDSRRYVWPVGYVYDLPIDWRKARDQGGISLAIMKSSEGATYTDPAFKMNWKGAKGILPRAAYHFFRCNQNAIEQAYHMIDLLEPDFNAESDYALLDFKTQDGRTGADCLKVASSFLYELKKWGTMPLIYTCPSFWIGIGGSDATWAKRYPLALAQWPMDNWWGVIKPPYLFAAQLLADLKKKVEMCAIRPMVLKPWDSPAIWQFTARADTKAIPGHPAVKKACDYNAVYMPLPRVDGLPVPPIVPLPEDRYQVTALTLKVFAGPGDMYRQVNLLSLGTIVTVTEVVTSGERWAHIEDPAGWCRAIWLEKM